MTRVFLIILSWATCRCLSRKILCASQQRSGRPHPRAVARPLVTDSCWRIRNHQTTGRCTSAGYSQQSWIYASRWKNARQAESLGLKSLASVGFTGATLVHTLLLRRVELTRLMRRRLQVRLHALVLYSSEATSPAGDVLRYKY